MHKNLYIVDRQGKRTDQPLLHGIEGNLQTAHELRDFVRNDLGLPRDNGLPAQFDQGLYDFAHQILATANVAGHDWKKEVSAIHNYVKRKIIYRRAPAGGNQEIADPRETIKTGFGKCTDLVALESVLLGMVGFQTRFVMAGYDHKETTFSHLYMQMQSPDTGTWHALDPTNPNSLPGWEAPDADKKQIYPVFDDADIDVEGFKKIFRKIGRGIKKGAKFAAPIAAGFIPGVGQFASAGVSAGFDALDAKGARKAAAQQEAARQEAEQQRQAAMLLQQQQAAPSRGDAASGEMPQAVVIGGAVVGSIVLLKLLSK